MGGDLGGRADEGKLVIPGKLNDVSTHIRARPGETLLLGSMPMCPRGSADVEVTGVKSLDPDVAVTGYTLRPNPFLSGGEMVGFERRTLEDAGLKRDTHVTLDRACKGDVATYELVVELRAGKADSATPGYDVLTSSGSGGGDLKFPYATYICVDVSTQECKNDTPLLPPDDVEEPAG